MNTILLRHLIGETLREARLSAGLTLREVADRGLTSLGYLSEVERGRKEASSELLASISAAVGLSQSALLTEAARKAMREERPELRAAA
ncbi:MAG: helix-turn-helix transcriptional regulator [Propionibacteriaceae bacterium]|nr:helix-turn-helix transcriptional regulator [Propionibacteriaceae bacterium]